MKIPALLAALVLTTGTALAHQGAGSAKAPVKAKQATQSMGAGPATLQTDLNAPARQARIEQAYTRWQSLRR